MRQKRCFRCSKAQHQQIPENVSAYTHWGLSRVVLEIIISHCMVMNGPEKFPSFRKLKFQRSTTSQESPFKCGSAINYLDINKHAFSVSLHKHFTSPRRIFVEITFLLMTPVHLSHFSSTRYKWRDRERFKSEMLCNFFPSLGCDIKFVFLVKWLEASEAAFSVSNLNGSWMVLA